MKRIRLTATAVAASSLGSLGLAGIGASSAHAAVTPNTAFSGKGFDTCAAPSDAQMDDWYAHSPYRGVGVYIGGSSYLCKTGDSPSGGYTADWVQHQAATGWGMWAIYAGKQGPDLTAANADPQARGVEDGADAARQAQKLGFASGTTVFLDIEPYHEDATAHAVNTYMKAFADELTKGGYRLRVYGGSLNRATGHSVLGDLVADPSLSSLVAAVDIAGTTASQANFNATTNDQYVPSTMWGKHQRIHQYTQGASRQFGSTTLSVDDDVVDLAPTSHLKIDPSAQHSARWYGSDRVGTAVATSQHLWPDTTANPADFYAPGDKRPQAKAAGLTRPDQYFDALGGPAPAPHARRPPPLARARAPGAGTAAGATPDSVVVLTDGTNMPAATSAFLHQWAGGAAGANVYPVGGAANTAAKTLGAVVPGGNLKLNTLVGADRYGTAALVARQFFGSTGTPHVYGVATGVGWADALSGGAAMGSLDGPLLLTDPNAFAGAP